MDQTAEVAVWIFDAKGRLPVLHIANTQLSLVEDLTSVPPGRLQ